MTSFERIMGQYFFNGEFHFDSLNSIDLSYADLSAMKKLTDEYRTNNFDATETIKRILKNICLLLDKHPLEKPKSALEKLQNELISSLTDKTEQYLIILLAQACEASFEDILEYEMDEETEAKFLWRY